MSCLFPMTLLFQGEFHSTGQLAGSRQETAKSKDRSLSAWEWQPYVVLIRAGRRVTFGYWRVYIFRPWPILHWDLALIWLLYRAEASSFVPQFPLCRNGSRASHGLLQYFRILVLAKFPFLWFSIWIVWMGNCSIWSKLPVKPHFLHFILPLCSSPHLPPGLSLTLHTIF